MKIITIIMTVVSLIIIGFCLLVLFRCNISVKPDHMRAIYDQIMSQKNTGVVVLPHYCDARIIPKGTKVVIEVEKENVYAQHER